MPRTRWFASIMVFGISLVSLAFVQSTRALSVPALTPMEQLGKSLFFDKILSMNGNQSCATCHDPAVGYTGPVSAINAHGAVYPGSDPALFGNRKPPSAAYAGDSALLRYDAKPGKLGGWNVLGRAAQPEQFWATRWQSKPRDPSSILWRWLSPPLKNCVTKSKPALYAALFDQVWGAGSLDCTQADIVYDRIGKSIAAYERSWEVNPYSSKFDMFWDKAKSKRLDVTKITTSNYTKYRNLGLTIPNYMGWLCSIVLPSELRFLSFPESRAQKGTRLFHRLQLRQPGSAKEP